MTYETFVQRLKASQVAVNFVAEYYKGLGYMVNVPELVIAPHTVGAFSQYADQGDLMIKKDNMSLTVEVKHSGKVFNNWTMPEMIVNSYTGWHSKKVKPDLHFIVAKDFGSAAIIDSKTSDQWELKRVYDSYKKENLLFYFVKKELVKFLILNQNQNKMAKQNHVIQLKIDVNKISKERLYEGKKGKYLTAAVILKDEPDQYGNDGFIVESISKEEREKGVKGTIIGNAKYSNFSEAEQGNDLPF